jgi:hypothetical protein
VEWERFGYRRDLSRAEIEHMSLREYILRRQAHTRDYMQTLRLETLPILNAWSKEAITLQDFMRRRSTEMDGEDRQALKALRYDIEQHTDIVDDWTLIDEQLANASD